ncbi:hypothetical protein ASD01_16810 [Ensifer sp. Root423]|nr:hypothetical protein ASD01_16810 [Ensifer sp. Root423]
MQMFLCDAVMGPVRCSFAPRADCFASPGGEAFARNPFDFDFSRFRPLSSVAAVETSTIFMFAVRLVMDP